MPIRSQGQEDTVIRIGHGGDDSAGGGGSSGALGATSPEVATKLKSKLLITESEKV